MAKTLREKYIEALKARGWIELKNTHRYTVFDNRDGGSYLYVGKSGSLRSGSTVAGSIPVSQKFKDQLLASVS